MHEPDATPDPATSIGIERRTIIKGAAWATPAIMLMTATPAFAASLTFAFTSATPAILNAANYTTPVAVSGTGVSGRTITISAPGINSVTANVDGQGKWSTTINLSGAADGQVILTATDGHGGSATQSVTKDTVAPTVEATQVVVAQNKQTGTISGTMSEAGTVVVSVQNLTLGTPTYSGTTWSVTFSGGENKTDYAGSVTATDTAGNVGTLDTFSWHNTDGTHAL